MMKLGMYVMPPDPILTVHFINPSHLYVYLLVVARQRLGKHVSAATVGELLDVSFCPGLVSNEKEPPIHKRLR
jgi:hypothetical protein